MPRRGDCLLALLLWGTTLALAQSARDLEADRLAEKLWRIIDITKQYQPQFQAYVTLEAPDGERVALTFHGERARTLVHDDVLTLERTRDIPADLPEDALGQYVLPSLATWGKPRWWSAWVTHEGHELSTAWQLYRLQRGGQETAL